MNASDLYVFLETEFGKALKPEPRDDGRAYYWREIKKAPKSTRLLRISETASGEVAEIKLAQSSLRAGHDILVPLPVPNDEVTRQAHLELSHLLNK